MDFLTSYNLCAGATGTAGSVPTSSSLCREIPECYTHDIERWVLEESQWNKFAWDVSIEEERAFAKGAIPKNAYVPGVSSSIGSAPQTEAETVVAQPIVQHAPRHVRNALDLDEIFEEVESSPLMKVIPFAQAEGVHCSVTGPTVKAGDYLPTVYPHSKFATPAFVTAERHPAPSTLSSRMPTPALSPSNSSIYCPDESDWEKEPTIPGATGLGIAANAVFAQNVFGLDSKAFSRPIASDLPHPGLLFPPLDVHQEQYALPAPPPVLMHENMIGQDFMAFQAPMHGPFRTPASKVNRTSKPYERKHQAVKANQHRSEPLHREESGSKEGRVYKCRYPGCKRSNQEWKETRTFKRHLETHPEYKSEWMCPGMLKTNGELCYGKFARKDALLRHLQSVHGIQRGEDIGRELLRTSNEDAIFRDYGI
ncbi:uncharacterized protein FOMMEDRAFT_162215 [Fomitiporia mediterranea MF3/22]|uniref:uncharacterized protein n=1 Tax=Fomitiporia mediterranea (strain MF3/22) TaxID=694068 RepID=UPI0004407E2A|nr:uncharacterized protein FOMMEDRAFT_162215 [Fomitiporia mediterranea MF3/22]EJC97876.1 hypothetical protein FOMMEDRAFT_162215 [Fomitiporia mediterranea MF3/22]